MRVAWGVTKVMNFSVRAGFRSQELALADANVQCEPGKGRVGDRYFGKERKVNLCNRIRGSAPPNQNSSGEFLAMLARKIARHGLTLALTALLGGFLSATLVRLAPGFGVDERELDPRLNSSSIQALRQSRAEEGNIFAFYFHFVQRAAHGDLGTSISLGKPVSELLRQRMPLTLRLVGIGLLLSWTAAMALALSAARMRAPAYDAAATLVAGAFLCIPAAVLALLSVLWNVPGSLAIGLIVFPRVYRYARNLLGKAYSQPHIVTARAKGLSESRILFWHVVPVIAPQLLAVAGISVSLAVGAAIPVEALCGLAGIGQLAWQAALARDLPLLVNITVLVALVTLLANSGADVVGHILRGERA